MINLKVTPEEALSRLGLIPHRICQKAIKNHWCFDDNNQISAQSICWLFCWAKTGCKSEAAKTESRKVFNAILDTTYSFFDARVPHEWARKARYAKDNNKIKDKLNEYLKVKKGKVL